MSLEQDFKLNLIKSTLENFKNFPPISSPEPRPPSERFAEVRQGYYFVYIQISTDDL